MDEYTFSGQAVRRLLDTVRRTQQIRFSTPQDHGSERQTIHGSPCVVMVIDRKDTARGAYPGIFVNWAGFNFEATTTTSTSTTTSTTTTTTTTTTPPCRIDTTTTSDEKLPKVSQFETLQATNVICQTNEFVPAVQDEDLPQFIYCWIIIKDSDDNNVKPGDVYDANLIGESVNEIPVALVSYSPKCTTSNPPTTPPVTVPPSTCGGQCTYSWIPATRTWFLSSDCCQGVGCNCIPPDWCPQDLDNPCLTTRQPCARISPRDPVRCTTTTTPGECELGCRYLYVPLLNSATLISNGNCLRGAPASDFPYSTCFCSLSDDSKANSGKTDCFEYTARCSRFVPAPPPPCSGFCFWVYVNSDKGYVFYSSTGCSPTTPQCYCDPPSRRGDISCNIIETTVCYSPDGPNGPGTPRPPSQAETCTWRGDGSTGWILVSYGCKAGSSCSIPNGKSTSACDYTRTPCVVNPTTTTSTTTSTTTTTTTPSCSSKIGCLYVADEFSAQCGRYLFTDCSSPCRCLRSATYPNGVTTLTACADLSMNLDSCFYCSPSGLMDYPVIGICPAFGSVPGATSGPYNSYRDASNFCGVCATTTTSPGETTTTTPPANPGFYCVRGYDYQLRCIESPYKPVISLPNNVAEVRSGPHANSMLCTSECNWGTTTTTTTTTTTSTTTTTTTSSTTSTTTTTTTPCASRWLCTDKGCMEFVPPPIDCIQGFESKFACESFCGEYSTTTTSAE